MRILHTSDWHLGKNLEFINRIEEQQEFIDCLCKTVGEQNIDLVLVAGDIYDTYNSPAAAEGLFYDAIDRQNDKGKRAVVVIAGNHDNPAPETMRVVFRDNGFKNDAEKTNLKENLRQAGIDEFVTI